MDEIEDQLSVIDHLESNLAAKLTSAQALRQSILRHAFSGRLAAQTRTTSRPRRCYSASPRSAHKAPAKQPLPRNSTVTRVVPAMRSRSQ